MICPYRAECECDLANESMDEIYWVSAVSLADSLTESSPIDKEETSLDMALGLLISPLLKDSTMFSRDCMSSAEMTFSSGGSFWECLPVGRECACVEATLEFCPLLLLFVGWLLVDA